jgi:hypothetical protein
MFHASDVLAERVRQLDISGDPGHTGTGFWGFMPDCFCYNCRSYFDPSGQEMANYLNCKPSVIDTNSVLPYFLDNDTLWPRSLRFSRMDRGGIFVETVAGETRQEVTLEELVLKDPPLSVEVMGRNGQGQFVIVLYRPVDEGYKSMRHVNGAHPSDSVLWAAEKLVIPLVDLAAAVQTVFDT